MDGPEPLLYSCIHEFKKQNEASHASSHQFWPKRDIHESFAYTIRVTPRTTALKCLKANINKFTNYMHVANQPVPQICTVLIPQIHAVRQALLIVLSNNLSRHKTPSRV